MQLSRRDFLGTLGAAALAPLSRLVPETVLLNANILTAGGALPRTQAVAIRDGRFEDAKL
jgi:hypothetical protein